MGLESRLDFEIKYAIDVLVIYSAEQALSFKQAPYLLNALLELMKDSLAHEIESLSPGVFVSYEKLLELSKCMNDRGVGNSKHSEWSLGIGLILRNASFHPENQGLLSQHSKLHEILFWTLNLPIPASIIESYEKNSMFMREFSTLEQRKNSLVTLSNIAHLFHLTLDMGPLLIETLADFIPGEYEYIALDVLSKLLLLEPNHRVIAACSLLDLMANIMKLLPRTWPIEPSQDELATYELSLVCVFTLCTLLNPESKSECQRMHSLHLQALCIKPAGFGTQYDTLRERCIKSISEVGAHSTSGLVRMIETCAAMGDTWMALHGSILLFERSE